MTCPSCGSTDLQKKGFVYTRGDKRQGYRCKSCERRFTTEISVRSRFDPDITLHGKRYVITSIQNNVAKNEEFYQALQVFCKHNRAGMIVIPTRYRTKGHDEITWDVEETVLFTQKASIGGLVNILPDIGVTATTDNPLAGLDVLSKGKSLIIPHNQLQMRSLPVQRDSHPVILHTTGTISLPCYSKTKVGEKADFNHSYSALFVDVYEDYFHIRVLNADRENGFYDIGTYYSNTGIREGDEVLALILGDEHEFVQDPVVKAVTFTNNDSIVAVLKPKEIIRHDILDCFTVSHHHHKDHLLQYSKFHTSKNRLEEELQDCFNYIIETTPAGCKCSIVSSNHHDHLKRWLTECNPKTEPWNAKLYHLLSFLCLQEIEKHTDIFVPDVFELYMHYLLWRSREAINIEFLSRKETYKIAGIEVSNHGDIGANGSRGSLNQYARFSDKAVIGHSHTPGINKGAYSVGCSTPKNLEYTNGPSSWMNTHCVIYPNGKRQLINIIKGHWK